MKCEHCETPVEDGETQPFRQRVLYEEGVTVVKEGAKIAVIHTVERCRAVLKIKYADAERSNRCDVCAGTGDPGTGNSCMCQGTGRMSVAAVYLRGQLLAVEQREKGLREALEVLGGRLLTKGDVSREALLRDIRDALAIKK